MHEVGSWKIITVRVKLTVWFVKSMQRLISTVQGILLHWIWYKLMPKIDERKNATGHWIVW